MNIELYSEECQEIIGQIPHWIIRTGMIVILLTLLMMLAGSWFFRFPEVVESSVTISPDHLPLSVVAKSNGKIAQSIVSNHQKVKCGDFLAIFESKAVWGDVKQLKTNLEYFKSCFPEIKRCRLMPVSEAKLGVLQMDFSNFYTNYLNYQNFLQSDYFKKKIVLIKNQIDLYQSSVNRLTLQKEKELIKHKNTKSPLDLSQIELEINNITIQIAKLKESVLDLTNQFESQNNKFQLAFHRSLKTLNVQIELWENDHVLKAPINGTVFFSQDFKKKKYIKQGSCLMKVKPHDPGNITGRLQLSQEVLRKVNVGQAVKIKFKNYPCIVKGKIKKISNVVLNGYYNVEVNLPKKLTTHCDNIDLTVTNQGVAEIQTENIRLFERLFFSF
ncbi:MAG: HlyD family efflux transporter periplasmic adaptor subunit [Deltaproteobacteria bacterium]|nr:HlyD family efflux transporter periplasmic adaptor subunit [Deltaproteobacteria bacterium]